MPEYLVKGQYLSDIADAIRSKTTITDGLEVSSMAYAIRNITADDSMNEKDINFWDYDGILLYSYTVDEFKFMTDLPPLPSRAGLICQGWNYDLATIKSHNRALDIGAIYTTDDGKTRIYVNLEEGYTSPMFGCCPNGTVTVDWGDGTTPDVLTGTSTETAQFTPQHSYAEPGMYTISLSVNGTMEFIENYGLLGYSEVTSDFRNAYYRDAILKIELGANIPQLRRYSLSDLNNVTSISIPNTINAFGVYTFGEDNSLTHINIPSGISYLDSAVFNSCDSLTTISLPNTITGANAMVFSNTNLKRIILPRSVTSLGYQCFSYSANLSKVETSSLQVTYGSFPYCTRLHNFNIPNTLTEISASMFLSSGLQSIDIPSSVINIRADAFYDCNLLAQVTLASSIPPTLSDGSVFPSHTIIYIPAGSYEAYSTATNWSEYADQMVEY